MLRLMVQTQVWKIKRKIKCPHGKNEWPLTTVSNAVECTDR